MSECPVLHLQSLEQHFKCLPVLRAYHAAQDPVFFLTPQHSPQAASKSSPALKWRAVHAQGLVFLENSGWVLHAHHLRSPLPKGALQHKAGLGPRQAWPSLHKCGSSATQGC